MQQVLRICVVLLLVTSCRDKVICPAFQSTYILDDSTRMAYYSYAWKLDQNTREKFLSTAYSTSDSSAQGGESDPLKYYAYAANYKQPAERTNRTKYGIVKYEPMWLRNYELKRAPMENVLGPKEDIDVIEETYEDVGDFVASDFGLDSMNTDSVLVAVEEPEIEETPEGPRYLFNYEPNGNNVEQEYYNKYYGEQLLWRPRPKPKPKANEENLEEFSEEAIPAGDSLNLPQEPEVIPADTTGQ